MSLFPYPMSRRGIALLNVVFLLIFIGVLIVAGLKMYDYVVTRGKLGDTKNGLESQARMAIAWAVNNKRLPASASEFNAIFGTAPLDAWGNPVQYHPADPAMTAVPTPPGNNICGRTSTPVYYSSPTNYVAFALLSRGGALTPGGTQWPASGALTIAPGDVARIVTLNELQARAGCAGVTLGYLRIVNNELPNACSGSTAYAGNLFGDGGAPIYTWSLVSPPSWLQINATTGALSFTSTPVAGPVTVKLQDMLNTTVQRTYNLNVVNCGGSSGNSGTGVNTGDTSTPPDANGNTTSASLFNENIVTSNNSFQVANNQIQFGFDQGNGAACIWFPYNFPLFGKTLRAYWKFVFSDNDTSSDSTAYADGYTFTLMQGSNPTSYCGTGSPYNASTNPYYNCQYNGHFGEFLAYCGLPNNNIAVEFDIYPNYGTQTRNDPSNNYNHVAVVHSITSHNGPPTNNVLYGDNTHNQGGNPACSTTVNPPYPACNGTCSGNNTCTGTCNGAAMTNGTCSGTCVGRCTGTCTWTGLATNGNCNGNCTGTCNGNTVTNASCSGTCYGACTGTNYDSKGASGGAACLYNSYGGNTFTIPSGHPNGATWLEDTSTHNMRVEVHTRCNNDCSSCDTNTNVPTNTCSPLPSAPGKVFVKAWIDKGNNDINSNEPSTPDVSYCMDLAAAMYQIKMGFTQATGAMAQMGTITNFNANTFGTCTPPTINISSPGLPNARVGTAYPVQTLTASGGTPPYSSWTLQGKLPPPLTFNSSTQTISGGTLNAPGRYDFAISLADACSADGGTGCNTIAQSQYYTVYVCSALSISTTTLPSGQVGVGYSKTMTSSGGTAPITWSASGLPAGLSIDPNSGVISGTPTTAGTTSVTVTATDACGSNVAVSSTYTLQIASASCQPLKITTTSPLPTGRVGTAYSATMSASGSGPFGWSATGLPAGLAISNAGVINGTPAALGNNTVSVSVKDNCSPVPQTKTASFSLPVRASVFSVINNAGLTLYSDSSCSTAIPNGSSSTINYTNTTGNNYYLNVLGLICWNIFTVTGSDADAADTNNNGQVQINTTFQLTDY